MTSERTVRNLYCQFSCIHEVVIFLELQVGFPLKKICTILGKTKCKISLALRTTFARKTSNLRNYSQMSFRAILHYSACFQVCFCAISLLPLRKKVLIKIFEVKFLGEGGREVSYILFFFN